MLEDYRAYIYQTPNIHPDAWVHARAFVVGAVTLGAGVSVWPNASIRADMHTITIGAYTNVQDNAVLHITHKSTHNPEGAALTIGREVTVGHSAILHGCTIGARVLVGMGSIVLDGAVVEDEVMIGAGSLVTEGKRLESGFLYVGRPAKKVRALTDSERAHFSYAAKNYYRLKTAYIS